MQALAPAAGRHQGRHPVRGGVRRGNRGAYRFSMRLSIHAVCQPMEKVSILMLCRLPTENARVAPMRAGQAIPTLAPSTVACPPR